ncbi:hypothetical protein GCM10010385_64590 [Streptomyces geysiriensis]|nr:hypothetical protein GCM10010385_64590 [Streptomyces geysiriensis]
MTDSKDQAPASGTEPGPVGFVRVRCERGGGAVAAAVCRAGLPGYASAAFAAMSVRYWEPSRPMRATAR